MTKFDIVQHCHEVAHHQAKRFGSYDDVKHDYTAYLPYMAPGGIIGFHDIFYSDEIFDSGSQAGFFWERMKRTYKRYDEFQYHSSMGIGIVYLP